MDSNRLDLVDKQIGLILAKKRGRSDNWCLRLWSRFIKARDGNQCAVCYSTNHIQAHHIFRKSLYPAGMFQPGNGITLCHECHELQHSIFNGRPDINMPVDAEGGDNLDDVFVYLDCLIKSADMQGLDHDEFYYIDDHMLLFFMRLQCCEHIYKFVRLGKYSRLSLAREIWRTSPPNMLAALIRANL